MLFNIFKVSTSSWMPVFGVKYQSWPTPEYANLAFYLAAAAKHSSFTGVLWSHLKICQKMIQCLPRTGVFKGAIEGIPCSAIFQSFVQVPYRVKHRIRVARKDLTFHVTWKCSSLPAVSRFTNNVLLALQSFRLPNSAFSVFYPAGPMVQNHNTVKSNQFTCWIGAAAVSILSPMLVNNFIFCCP
jgi:hypothetical protein